MRPHLRWLLLSLVVIAAGCGGFIRESWRGTLTEGEYAVPVAQWHLDDGSTLLCAGGGWPDLPTLHGSPTDRRIVWVQRGTQRVDVAWPNGWKVRFEPALELLDETGAIVGREGSHVDGGCETAEPNVYAVSIAR